MYCERHRSTMTTDACIKRQKIAQQNYVTIKTHLRDNKFHYRQVNAPESFAECANCKQGALVRENPSSHTNEDVGELARNHIMNLTHRGFIYRESAPDLKSLEMAGNIEKAELNYIEGRHNVNVEMIARVSNHSVKRRKTNAGKSQIIIGRTGAKLNLSDRTVRIIRYLCKQGYFARSQSYFLQSLGLCASVG